MTDAAGDQRVLNRHTYVPHYLMVLANGLASGQSRLYLKQLGLGLNECRIATLLAHVPGLQASEMSAMLSMNKSIVSRSVRALARRGMIEPAHPNTPRKLRLTALGLRRHRDIVEVALERERLLLTGFTPNDKTIMLGYLARLFANMPIVDAYAGLPQPAGENESIPSPTAETR
jgi:DNA-binding MarR family transcriptional regulator